MHYTCTPSRATTPYTLLQVSTRKVYKPNGVIMPIQYQCGSSMAIRQICHYKYTNRICINQILVRWSSTSWHKKRPIKGRFFASKGTREAELRNSFIFTFPPNLPLKREACGKCSTYLSVMTRLFRLFYDLLFKISLLTLLQY